MVARPLSEAAQILAEPGLERPGDPALEMLDEPAHDPERVLERKPRVALAKLGPRLRADVTRRDAQRARLARLGREPAGRQDRVQQRQAERGQDRRGPEVPLDPFQDGPESDQLAIRMEIEQFIGEVLGAIHDREAREHGSTHRCGPDIGRCPPQVVGVQRRLTAFGPATLVAADGAAVVAGQRLDPPGDPGVVADRPDHLVDDQRTAARSASRREVIADRGLEAGLTPGRGGHALERRIEVPDVGRSQHDLGEHPRQRARFERDGLALAIERRAGNPATTSEQVGHDIAGPRVLLDPCRHDRRWRGRCHPVEDRQRVARLGVEGSTSGHREDASPRGSSRGAAARTRQGGRGERRGVAVRARSGPA